MIWHLFVIIGTVGTVLNYLSDSWTGPSGPCLKYGQNTLSHFFFSLRKMVVQLSNYCVQTFPRTVTLSLRGLQLPSRSPWLSLVVHVINEATCTLKNGPSYRTDGYLLFAKLSAEWVSVPLPTHVHPCHPNLGAQKHSIWDKAYSLIRNQLGTEHPMTSFTKLEENY